MKFRWKSTILYAVLGTILISLLMWFGTFRNCSIDAFFGNVTVDISEEVLSDGAKDYKIVDEEWCSVTDDAWIFVNLPLKGKVESIELDVESVNTAQNNKAQIYYSRNNEFSANAYMEYELEAGINKVMLDSDVVTDCLRLDLTSSENETFKLNGVTVNYTNEKTILFWCVTPILICLYVGFVIWRVNKNFIREFISGREKLRRRVENIEQICALAWSDFRNRFSGSYLGIFWGIIQPLSTILLFWFVFQVGLRSNPVDDVPFILWLAAGMIPWNYFYDSWANGTSTFISYGYIVKKVVFNVELLPMVKALSSVILNVIFNVILIVIYILYGEYPGYHIINMIYFSICLMALSLGLTYITATLNVFIKDIGQFLGIALQFLMWLTPMMWDYHMIEKYSLFYELNPLHYVINGYREALINGHWFFHHWGQMLWFWFVTIVCIVFGKRLLRKMKLHFADVL